MLKLKCPRCNQTKHSSLFFKDKSKYSGYQSYCKKCKGEWKLKNWASDLCHRAKSHTKREFTLTPLYVKHLFEKQNGKCYWFGVELVPSLNPRDPQQPSLDRIDNTKGYVEGNVVLACYVANMGRNSTDPERFEAFVKLLKKVK